MISRELLLLISLAALAMILPLTASAEDGGQKTYAVSSGTGFYISKSGYAVTNNHVIKGCREVMVRGAVDQTEGEVTAFDPNSDLALVRTFSIPPHVATLRSGQRPLTPGERVLVMGYPLERAMSGIYSINEAKLISPKGPQGEGQWIQFTDSARKGNSGGPLLDASGNVAGVIVGKVKMTRTDSSVGSTPVTTESDIAISLSALEGFLKRNSVLYRTGPSVIDLPTDHIENQAKLYIVNIHCRHTPTN